MKNKRGLEALVRDIRSVRDYEAACRLNSADAGRFAANVGDVMTAALAAIGVKPTVQGGAYPCETDYLAARGATFPAVPEEELVAFNRRTLRVDMDESDEMRRYVMIADFFRRAAV